MEKQNKVYEGFKELVRNVFLPDQNEDPLPFRDEDKKKIDQALKGILTSKEDRVIRFRFGLEDKPKTLREIGEIMGMCRENVRRIEGKALKKMHHSAEVKLIGKSFFRSLLEREVECLTQENERLRKYNSRLWQKLNALELQTSNNPFLSIPVDDDELSFSVRVKNCCKDIGIKTISDLIAHSERELLKERNLGKKSLAEIKEVLFYRGLRLQGN